MTEHEKKVLITNEHGLHARPATQFVQIANQFDCEIQVIKGELTVDGKSVMSMLRLGATKGTVLRIRARGGDADKALEDLADLIGSRFGEE